MYARDISAVVCYIFCAAQTPSCYHANYIEIPCHIVFSASLLCPLSSVQIISAVNYSEMFLMYDTLLLCSAHLLFHKKLHHKIITFLLMSSVVVSLIQQYKRSAILYNV